MSSTINRLYFLPSGRSECELNCRRTSSAPRGQDTCLRLPRDRSEIKNTGLVICRPCSFPVPHISQVIRWYLSRFDAITIPHRRGGFKTTNVYLSQFLEAGKSQIQVTADCVQGGPTFWVRDDCLLAVSSHCRRDEGPSGISLRRATFLT